MATRAAKLWRSVANRGFTTATAPRMKPFALTADIMHHGEHHATKSRSKGISANVALGAIAVSLSFGAVTAKQQIAYNPTVRVNKKRREIIPEIEYPDRIVNETEKYVNKSLFRKVAHIRRDSGRNFGSDPVGSF